MEWNGLKKKESKNAPTIQTAFFPPQSTDQNTTPIALLCLVLYLVGLLLAASLYNNYTVDAAFCGAERCFKI